MTRAARLTVLPLLLATLAAAGCSAPPEAAAMVACESIIDRRVGADLTHDGPLEGATVTGSGPYVVRSAFTDPATARLTNYVCTIERNAADDGWQLIDLTTDR